MYKIKDIRENLFELFFVTVFLLGILIFPSVSFKGAYNSLILCGNVLIPSLFPFMFLSSFAIKSSFADLLSKVFGTFSSFCFKLPKITGTTVLFSLIGGYPVGAKSIASLYNESYIDEKTAERMAYFCCGGGPAFIIGTLGCTLYKNYLLGLIIFISQALSIIIIGLFLGIGEKLTDENKKISKKSKRDFFNNFISSCRDSSSAVFMMCFLVIIFGSVLSLTENILKILNLNNDILTSFIYLFLEICNGTYKSFGKAIPYEMTAFFVGFGGICVHMQIFSILGDIKINKLKFFLCRLAEGILTSGITYFLIEIFPVASAVFNSESNIKISFGNSVTSAVSIVVMTVVFLFGITKKNDISEKTM